MPARASGIAAAARGVGPSSGAGETFWSIRSARPSYYPKGFGPWSMNFVAVKTTRPNKTPAAGIWFGALDPERLEPQDLHAAQLLHRQAG